MEKDKVMKRFAVADEEKINELKNKTKINLSSLLTHNRAGSRAIKNNFTRKLSNHLIAFS